MNAAAPLVAPGSSAAAGSATNELPPGCNPRFCLTADDAQNLPLPQNPWPVIALALELFPPRDSLEFRLMAWAWSRCPGYFREVRLSEALRWLEIPVADYVYRNLGMLRYTEFKLPLIAVLHHALMQSVEFGHREGLV